MSRTARSPSCANADRGRGRGRGMRMHNANRDERATDLHAPPRVGLLGVGSISDNANSKGRAKGRSSRRKAKMINYKVGTIIISYNDHICQVTVHTSPRNSTAFRHRARGVTDGTGRDRKPGPAVLIRLASLMLSSVVYSTLDRTAWTEASEDCTQELCYINIGIPMNTHRKAHSTL